MHDTSKSRQVAAHASIHDRICVDPSLNRKLVSYQGNKAVPGFRWMKYKEGFSADLVERLLKVAGAKAVLDPFSGIGTAPLTASRMGDRICRNRDDARRKHGRPVHGCRSPLHIIKATSGVPA